MPRKATRSAQGGGSIRQRKDGKWEGRYTLGRDPGTGKQVQKSVYGESQSEVRKKLQQITTQIDDGVFTVPEKILLGQWLDIWLSEYCLGVKKSTLSTYKRRAETIIKPALGAVKLTALTAPTVQAFINNLQRGKGRPRPLSPKTILNVHGVLHKALRQAMELGYLRANPSDACKLPRVEKPEIKVMEGDKIKHFLDAIQGHKNERALIVAIFTGMRQSELIGLTWDCIDFDRGSIRLYKQLQLIDGTYESMSLKNDKSRRITPAPFVMDTLREQKLAQAEW